jgi:hypothetical protein
MHHPIVYGITVVLVILLLCSFIAYLYDAYKTGTDTAYFVAFLGVLSLLPSFLYFNGVLNAASGH